MYVDVDEMRVRAALDSAVQNSTARYFRQTERARQDFQRADEATWAKYYPWYRGATTYEGRVDIMSAYKREVMPYAAAYKRAVEQAEIGRKTDKTQIEFALQVPEIEEKIRLLRRIL